MYDALDGIYKYTVYVVTLKYRKSSLHQGTRHKCESPEDLASCLYLMNIGVPSDARFYRNFKTNILPTNSFGLVCLL
jgi:hypothetical protein